MGNLTGKVAIVTGGSRGIGRAIAKRFASDGADVAITYAGNEAAAAATVDAVKGMGRRAVAIKADAADTGSAGSVVKATIELFGGLDIVVHSAGVAQYESITGMGLEEYLDHHRKHFSVNVDGVVALTAAAVPDLRDGGRIIIIGSVNAHQLPFPGGAVYGASKAAAAALARGWARDLGPRGILVNVIQPGPIDTEMNPADDRVEAVAMAAMTALKRYGTAEEIAALAAFLASDESSYITGSAIDIDGGFSI